MTESGILHFLHTNMSDRIKCERCKTFHEFRGEMPEWKMLFDHAITHGTKCIRIDDRDLSGTIFTPEMFHFS